MGEKEILIELRKYCEEQFDSHRFPDNRGTQNSFFINKIKRKTYRKVINKIDEIIYDHGFELPQNNRIEINSATEK